MDDETKEQVFATIAEQQQQLNEARIVCADAAMLLDAIGTWSIRQLFNQDSGAYPPGGVIDRLRRVAAPELERRQEKAKQPAEESAET